jgi:hypothetical protein
MAPSEKHAIFSKDSDEAKPPSFVKVKPSLGVVSDDPVHSLSCFQAKLRTDTGNIESVTAFIQKDKQKDVVKQQITETDELYQNNKEFLKNEVIVARQSQTNWNKTRAIYENAKGDYETLRDQYLGEGAFRTAIETKQKKSIIKGMKKMVVGTKTTANRDWQPYEEGFASESPVDRAVHQLKKATKDMQVLHAEIQNGSDLKAIRNGAIKEFQDAMSKTDAEIVTVNALVEKKEKDFETYISIAEYVHM